MRTPDSDSAVTIEARGETTLLLRFGHGIDSALSARVHEAAAALRAARLRGVVDLVPAYATLAITYAPGAWSDGEDAPWRRLTTAIRAILEKTQAHDTSNHEAIEIPVRYGSHHGPDLDELTQQLDLSTSDFIARHAAVEYRVAMIGFAPGFPYLLGLDPTLHAPRRANPRTRVPRGSVAIGGAQTGIYPSQLPGGWQLIGRTPLVLFDALREPPCLLAAGDRVHFRAIEDEEFDALERTRSG